MTQGVKPTKSDNLLSMPGTHLVEERGEPAPTNSLPASIHSYVHYALWPLHTVAWGEGQRQLIGRSWFLPHTWAWEIKLQWLGLVTSAFIV